MSCVTDWLTTQGVECYLGEKSQKVALDNSLLLNDVHEDRIFVHRKT